MLIFIHLWLIKFKNYNYHRLTVFIIVLLLVISIVVLRDFVRPNNLEEVLDGLNGLVLYLFLMFAIFYSIIASVLLLFPLNLESSFYFSILDRYLWKVLGYNSLFIFGNYRDYLSKL